jgi:TfoX/Sxy family transcriptional regulator of competence genes
MASEQGFVAYVLDQIGAGGEVACRKMFGEYAIYCDGKVVALVCDNQLFVKPTAAGRALLGEVEEAPPYPGARPYFLIGDRLDDQQEISRLIARTAEALPAPQPKRPRAEKGKGRRS